MKTSYPDDGYPDGDPRLSFIEQANHSFPYALLRIANLFDSSFPGSDEQIQVKVSHPNDIFLA
jgi:hypothetical protein